MMMNTSTPVNSEFPADVEGTLESSQVDATLSERRLALALWKAEHNQLEAAQQLFKEALSFTPTNATIRLIYAVFLARQQDWLAAKRELMHAATFDAAVVREWLNNELNNNADTLPLMYLQALLWTHLGQYTEARAAFEQILKVAPRHGQAWLDQAALFERLNDWEAADHSYQQLLEVDPDNVTWLIAYGTFLERCSRDKVALRFLERALTLNPEDEDLQGQVERLKQRTNQEVEARKRAALAKLKLEEQDSLAEATALITEALRIDPECALAHRVQADILKRAGLLTQAEVHLNRAMALEPNNSEYQAAYQAFQTELETKQRQVQWLITQAQATPDREFATLQLDKALELISDDIEVHVAYAGLLWPDQPDNVEHHLRAALSVAPQHPEATRKYITLLLAQARWPEAEQYFQVILEAQPQDEALMDQYAGWLIDQGRYQEVVDWIQNRVRSWPESTQLTGRLAVALARLGQLAEALPHFEQVLQWEPQNGLFHFEYAIILRDMDQWAKAEKHFRQAVELKYETPIVHREYALLLLKQQRYSEAQYHVQQAQLLSPSSEKITAVARRIEERCRQFEPVEEELAYAVLLGRQGAVVEAQQAFNQALTLDPSSIAVRKEYGKFLQSQDKIEQAETMLAEALKIVPDDQETKTVYVSILKEYALSLEQQGQLEQALDKLTKALQIVPEEQELETHREAITDNLTLLSPPPIQPLSLEPSSSSPSLLGPTFTLPESFLPEPPPEPPSIGLIEKLIQRLFGRTK